MALETRKTSQWWYGRWMQDGKRHCARLKVKAAGQPGDDDFEESRKAAQAELEKVMAGYKEQKRPEDLVQEIHRVKFGRRIGSIPLPRLFEAWQNIPRKRKPRKHYVAWAKRTFQRLLEFLRAEFPRVKEMAAVDKTAAEGFMRHEEARKISPKTYNAELILLRGAFEHLREDAGMLTNPFARIVTKDRETIHRKPFTPEELKAILDAVKDDDLMRPLIVVGVCTAMRRGDACLLKWADVDLENGYIRVKTSKTGETVEIPILPYLREELGPRPAGAKEFVFPELARMYRENPDGINWRLGKVFEKAGFIDEAEVERRNEGRRKAGLPELQIERRGDVHAERDGGIGLHPANVRGFHSFRVTWITMALAAGVPMELVRRVTGHKAVDVVLKNYFKPGRLEFAKAIAGAMPKMLVEAGAGSHETGVRGQKREGTRAGSEGVYAEAATPAAMIRAAIEALKKQTARNWRAKRDEALRSLRGAADWVDGHILHEETEKA